MTDKDNLPVNWEEKMASYAVAQASLYTAPVQPISLRGGMMSMDGTPVPNNTLECIVVASVFENAYFEDDYDPENIVPPTCYAHAPTKEGGMIPAENVVTPINDVCAGCEMAEWGSASGNSRGKACKEKVKLALIPADTSPDKVASADIALLSLPVMSVKNWSKHVNVLAAKYHRPPWGMNTIIKVVPDAKSQFRVTFEEGAPLDQEMLGPIHERIDACQEVLLQPYDYSGNEEKEPAKPIKGSKKR